MIYLNLRSEMTWTSLAQGTTGMWYKSAGHGRRKQAVIVQEWTGCIDEECQPRTREGGGRPPAHSKETWLMTTCRRNPYFKSMKDQFNEIVSTTDTITSAHYILASEGII
jgi:hypothetical protein